MIQRTLIFTAIALTLFAGFDIMAVLRPNARRPLGYRGGHHRTRHTSEYRTVEFLRLRIGVEAASSRIALGAVTAHLAV